MHPTDGAVRDEGVTSTQDPLLEGALCLVAHPLLEDVRCQRLQGHPGKHGAGVETRSAEIFLEWTDDPVAPA